MGSPASQGTIDTTERGAVKDGAPQTLTRRLFMQLVVFEVAPGASVTKTGSLLCDAMQSSKIPSVVYENVNDPRGFGLLTWSEDPASFVSAVRPALSRDSLDALRVRHDFTMLGRTYSTGFEPDLEYWLLKRPVEHAVHDKYPWAVWYPLRRSGAFARLAPDEQRKILGEHAMIGRAYGVQDLAHDIRLACHALDAADNEFVIGLVGAELHPLSHLVQAMRATRQTSEFIAQMGPFFVGRRVFVNP